MVGGIEMIFTLQVPRKCNTTNLTFYQVNGEVYIKRDDLTNMGLSYIPRDTINRVGKEESRFADELPPVTNDVKIS